MRNFLFAVALGFTTPSVLAGAGHDKSSHGVRNVTADRAIRVTAGDLWFKPDDLSVAPGETVKFVIENTGKLEHEFVIGSAEEQEAHRTMMQEMANSDSHDMSGGHHNGMSGQAMPSVTVAPGETKTLLWNAEEAASDALVYACNIPGHFEAGMKGRLTVRS